MANLFDYIVSEDPKAQKRIPSSVANRLGLNVSWREDLRQQILLAWMESVYDPARDHDEIMSYAYRCAVFAAREWRRDVLLPAKTQRGNQSFEPFSLHYDTVHEDTGNRWISEEDDSLITKDLVTLLSEDNEAPEPTFSAHCLQIPPQPRGSARRPGIGYTHLIHLFSIGMDVDEIAAATQLSERTVYRRLSKLKYENHY